MLNIAGLNVDWQNSHSAFVSGFESDKADSPVIKISFPDELLRSYSVEYTDKPFSRFLKGTGGEFLLADDKWSDVCAYGNSTTGEYSLPLAALCSRFSYFDAILMHASVIDSDGQGILFTGPSGIGKTTQAELWNRYKNAVIINGDKAFVRCIDGRFYACGLPWKGSSDYSVNGFVPIKAIVVLSQSVDNKIASLGNESVEKLSSNIFFPHWDQACLDNVFRVFDALVKCISVYHLACRPDKDSVELLHKTVFG